MRVGCGRYRWVMAAGSERPLNEVKFLTVAEVASVMRVSKMTVYRLVHSGHLPAIRWAGLSGFRSKRFTSISASLSWGSNPPEISLGLRPSLGDG